MLPKSDRPPAGSGARFEVSLQRISKRMTVRFFWMLLGGVAALDSLLFLALYVTR
jgi:hypothetical protein